MPEKPHEKPARNPALYFSRRVEVLDGGDLPVSIVKVLPLILHISLAGAIPRHRRARLILTGVTGVVPDPIGTSPVSAEGVGEDVEVVVHELVGIAGGGREIADGSAPGGGHGLIGEDVIRDLATGEPPDADTGLVPFGSVDTTSDTVERGTVRVVASQITYTTTRIGSRETVTVGVIVIPSRQCPRLHRVGHGTPRTGMKRNLILVESVDSLEDIDFTAVRPVGSVGPPGRPSSTPSGHVHSVKQDHPPRVNEVSVQPHGFTTTRDVLGLVNGHDGVALAVDGDETLVPSSTGIDIVDGSVGRIRITPEVEVVKEV